MKTKKFITLITGNCCSGKSFLAWLIKQELKHKRIEIVELDQRTCCSPRGPTIKRIKEAIASSNEVILIAESEKPYRWLLSRFTINRRIQVLTSLAMIEWNRISP